MVNVDFIKNVDRLTEQERLPSFTQIFNNIFERKKALRNKKAVAKEFIDKIIDPTIEDLYRTREVKVVEFYDHGVTTIKDGNKIFDVYDSLLESDSNGIVYLRGLEVK